MENNIENIQFRILFTSLLFYNSKACSKVVGSHATPHTGPTLANSSKGWASPLRIKTKQEESLDELIDCYYQSVDSRLFSS